MDGGYLTVSDEVFMGMLWVFLLTYCMNRLWYRTRHRQTYYLDVATPVILLGPTKLSITYVEIKIDIKSQIIPIIRKNNMPNKSPTLKDLLLMPASLFKNIRTIVAIICYELLMQQKYT